MTNDIQLGKVYTIRGSRRRYIAVNIDQFGRVFLAALSGSHRGSQPSGVEASELALASDQTLEFTGASATSLKSTLMGTIAHVFARFDDAHMSVADVDAIPATRN